MKKFVVFALGVTVFAQNGAQNPAQSAPQNNDQTRISVDVTRVNLLFTVSDKKGRFVQDLVRDDFDIVEGKKSQEIVEFTSEANLPLRLAILIDTSNSVRERFKFQQEAATDFLNTVLRPHQDKAMVVSFDMSAELVADLTEDVQKLGDAIHGLRPGGGTALYDAIYFACRDKLTQDQPMDKFRRAMIILSDGEDNQSRWTREQALEMAHKSDVVIYTISTNRTGLETDGDKILKYFAAETGGLAFFPFKADDLTQDFSNIASELRHQYSVLFRPDPLVSDGHYHAVKIVVKNHKDLVVRARHGYYAPNL